MTDLGVAGRTSLPMGLPRRVHRLHPGDVAVGERGDRLETLLGSCVAIVLADPKRTVGAMCHVVHARPAVNAGDESTAHGDTALARLDALMRARGLNLSLCDAWIVGGGNMFPHLVQGQHVGACNVSWARRALKAAGVRVRGVDVGGAVYRRLAWTVGDRDPETETVSV